MSGDYVPHSEVKLLPWLERFVGLAEDHAAEIGLSAGELAELQSNLQIYLDAHSENMAAQTAARAACRAKDDARKNLLPGIRSLAMRMQSHPNITDADKAGLGLTFGKPNGHTPLTQSDERPTAIIDISQRLKHILRVFNQTPTGIKKARPANAHGCEVWRMVGDELDGSRELQYVATITHNPHIVNYTEADGGKQAHYKLRWVGRHGEKGPWSETESVTIAA